jgi:NitT/TauT family transport system substrate-binding protein
MVRPVIGDSEAYGGLFCLIVRRVPGDLLSLSFGKHRDGPLVLIYAAQGPREGDQNRRVRSPGRGRASAAGGLPSLLRARKGQPMSTRRVRNVALLVTAATLVFAAGCSGGGSAAAPPGVEKPNLNVAVVPALDSAGFFVALYEGLFKAEGLNVHFTPATSSDDVISAQVKGTYDITGGNYVSYIQWEQAGKANLDIFAEGSVMEPGAQGIYTMPDSHIKTLADLKGKTVAINAPDNILYLLAASVLAEHAINPNTVHFVTTYSFPQMPAALKSGAVDAAVLPEPFASVAEQTDGAVSLVDLDQGATTSFPVAGYVVTKQWAKEYPRTLAAFYTALEQGQEIADSNRAAVEQAMEDLPMTPEPLGVSKAIAAVMALDNYPFTTGPVGAVDPVRLQRVVDVMQQFLGFPKFNIDTMLMGG